MISTTILALALFAATDAKPLDAPKQGPATRPEARASEDTVIDYTGGTPDSFAAALDADDSTYNRALDCASLSGVGTATAYDTITITNNAPDPASFVVTSSLVGGGACGSANDTFLTLYDSFNPGSPLTGCLAVNDDIAGAANRCSTLSFSIPVGQTRVVVVTAFDNAAAPAGLFDYQINFTGTVPVELMHFDVE